MTPGQFGPQFDDRLYGHVIKFTAACLDTQMKCSYGGHRGKDPSMGKVWRSYAERFPEGFEKVLNHPANEEHLAILCVMGMDW